MIINPQKKTNIKPLSGNCSVGLGEPERGRKSISTISIGHLLSSAKQSLSPPYAYLHQYGKSRNYVSSIWIYAIQENHPLQIVFSYISPLVFLKDLGHPKLKRLAA